MKIHAKKDQFAGRFFIRAMLTSDAKSSASPGPHSDFNYILEMENVTTIPYDTKVLAAMPDQACGHSFQVNTKPATSWTAEYWSLSEVRASSSVPLNIDQTSNSKVRVVADKIEYRPMSGQGWKVIDLDPLIEVAAKPK